MVDLRACAICHSDISYAEGAWGGPLPAVYGHEAAGVVSRVGPGVESLRPGDHVVATLIRSCGTCHYCGRGSRVMCEEVFPLDEIGPLTAAGGERLVQSMRTGAFAEKIVVHESQAVAVPADMPFASACLLACGVITGYGAVANTAKVRQGQTVAVVGCGGVGLNSVQAAAIAGASTIVALDLSADKLEAARAFGATHAFNPANADTAAAIMALTENRGVDFVFVTVGAKAAFEGAFSYLTKNGAVVIVGMPPSGVFASYDPGTMAAWNQKILGSKMGEAVIAHDIPMLVEHYRAGRLKLDELVSARYPLDRINEAIAAVNEGKALRNVIVFG
ncbi:MAG: zinc-binding dehydrogenase [Rhizobiaceae bacterium]|nr:zinc-binding dehydrogenase [Rhizobiaceae bacterium]MCV0408590.1 zinc-binding dehydrogenase [Rhizobiaceae bacterium]